MDEDFLLKKASLKRLRPNRLEFGHFDFSNSLKKSKLSSLHQNIYVWMGSNSNSTTRSSILYVGILMGRGAGFKDEKWY